MTEAPMNERVAAMLAETEVTPIPLALSDATVARVREAAEARGWSFEQALEAAFLRGVIALEQETAEGGTDRTTALRRAQEAGGLYAALKFQHGKLEKGVFEEETRQAGISSMTATFEELIGRLRER
jgi:hypothetical protein